ncbi:MAG TPA: DUF4349 domain-containing protein [Actinomycetota bacterium]|nr:DUF4349 domain-containing protein [Actinomycetota bacterium]
MIGSKRVGAAVLVLVLVFVLGACSGGDGGGASAVSGGGEADSDGGRVFDMSEPQEVNNYDQAKGISSGGGGGSTGGVVGRNTGSDGEVGPPPATYERGPTSIGPSVIKTADLRLQLPRDTFDASVRKATTVAERYGGYIISSGIEDRERNSASATLRVPADRFGAALGALRGLGEVTNERISGEDVTQEFIDLEARLRNYRAQERVLLDLMARSQTIADTIRVQNELTGIQLEVERIRGRLRYLNDQASFSTIFVHMVEKGAPPPAKVGVLGKAWERAVEGFFAVIGAVIVSAGVVVPIAILVALAVLVLRWLRPRLIAWGKGAGA